MLVDTGTVVTFFLTRIMDRFFLVVFITTRRKLGVDRNSRRGSTFPSGFVGEVDV